MRIFVFGNINSGKTTIIEELKNNLPDFSILQIDNYRKKFGDGTKQGEIQAQTRFINSVFLSKDAIVEATGLGPLGAKLRDTITYKHDILLYVDTPCKVCLERIESKKFSQIPYPKVSENIEDTINRCANEFSEGDLNSFWKKKVFNIIKLTNTKDLLEIPFELYKGFSNIVDVLYDDLNIESIYTYGSFARNELHTNSDIDAFIVSPKGIDYFLDILSKKTSYFIDNIQNKITIRFDSHLIELLVINRLQEGERFIIGSEITNLLSHAIKLNKTDKDYLINLDIDRTNPIDDIDFLVAKMVYYLLELPKIIQKNDKYRYYYESAIVVHAYVRVAEISKNNIKRNYLPHVDYLEYQEFLQINYNDLESHKNLLKKAAIKLLAKLEPEYINKYRDVLKFV